MRFLELRNCTTCGVKKVQRAWVLQIGFSTNLSRLQQGPFSQKQKDFIAVTSKKEDKLYCKIPFVVSFFKKIGEDCKNRRNYFIFSWCLKITQNVAFECLHFPPIFVLLKLTCLVTLYGCKLQVFKNSPKWTIFGIFN